MLKISCISLHLIFASALKVNQYPEFGTENFTYNEECGDRNNYKCWKKGGHSLDRCLLGALRNPPDSPDWRSYSSELNDNHKDSMLGNTPKKHIGWVPQNTNDADDTDDMAPYSGGWMQINLGEEQEVVGVATQGRGDGPATHQQWVTLYRVKISKDEKTWTDVKTAAGTMDFTGNIDNEGVVTNRFPKVLAQYVRILIRKGCGVSNAMTLRAGVVVC